METKGSYVLLITFNRPQYVKILLEALKKAGVNNLLVFRDGPRPNNYEDEVNCKAVKSLIDEIDWNCNVITNYMQNNLGCGYGPYSAISWAFQFTEKLIILEDDCIPTISFFDFCYTMLDKYEDDSRVRLISGRSQYQEHDIFKKYDYVFTQYGPTWGWATWKRVWQGFDLQERCLKPFFEKGGFTNQFANNIENKYWNYRYFYRLNPVKDVFHIWDYQFGAYSRISGAVAIVPKCNLIKYIGIEGTHPVMKGGELNILEATNSFKVSYYPSSISLDQNYEKDYFERFHGFTLRFRVRCYLNRIKNLWRNVSF